MKNIVCYLSIALAQFVAAADGLSAGCRPSGSRISYLVIANRYQVISSDWIA